LTDKPLRLALFDCDGTLVDSVFAIQRAMVQVFEKFSYKEPDLDETKLVIGLSLDRAIARLLDRPVDDEILKMVTAYKQIFAKNRGDISFTEPLFPGIPEMLTALENKDDVLLGIVTGKSRLGIDKILEPTSSIVLLQSKQQTNARRSLIPQWLSKVVNKPACFQKILMSSGIQFSICKWRSLLMPKQLAFSGAIIRRKL